MNLRKKLIILPELQRKIISPFVWMSLAVIALNVGFFGVFFNNVMAALNVISDQAVTVHFLNSLMVGLVLLLILNLVVLVSFTYFFFYLSNRIAGPVFRIEEHLDFLKETGQFKPIILRENDLLKSLADKINGVCQK
jgi:uncharacterized protein involved in cysteine biosynthesis